MAKRKTARPPAARAASRVVTRDDARIVQFVTPDRTISLTWPAPGSRALGQLQKRAVEWTHVVRNRARWVETPALKAKEDENARELIAALGLSEEDRRYLATAGSVRVTVPCSSEQQFWEARILPWEIVLPSATRDLRTGSLVVTRALRRASRGHRKVSYRRVLFVESAPWRLSAEWEFAEERRLVQHYTQPAGFQHLVSPTRTALGAAVRKQRPEVVHLAGFDTHQGLELTKDPRAIEVLDGFLLADDKGSVDPVPAAELAALVAGGAHPPALVFCNFWNSAARVAPMLVAQGAGAAIAFQDSIHDALAEIFVGNFYRALMDVQQLDAAFKEGWRPLQAQSKRLQATGIVLWTDSTQATEASTDTPPAAARMRETPAVTAEQLSLKDACSLVTVTVEPEPQFSYGLLHNNRDLFKSFLIRNLSNAPISDLQVHVELHSNEGTYPYRQSFAMDSPVLDLSSQVRIALTSQLARTLDEVLRTSLYVRVQWGPHELFRQTFPVTMAPVDQWADTDTDRIFLPSFVFPRDRAVGSVIKNAEQFVTALRDDPRAGFDGYQALDFDRANPAEDVDRQVQALWYSVVYRVPASYINPPPTYAIASQRIRTPSEIVAGGFGTCIDLALMFASCLEAVEIHPVVFLLNDHAFPGYWRTDQGRTAFSRRVASMAAASDSGEGAARGDGGSAKRRAGAPWCFDSPALEEIRRAIDRNQLVPIESVGLTGRSSFSEAVADAHSYFEPEEASRFLMMLDVVTARERRVTPLPLGPRLQ